MNSPIPSPAAIAYLESHGLANGGVLILPSSVRRETLVSICDDYLSGRVTIDDLQEISGILLKRPDHSWHLDHYDPQYDYDDRVELCLVEFWAPEIQCTPPADILVRKVRAYLLDVDEKPWHKQ